MRSIYQVLLAATACLGSIFCASAAVKQTVEPFNNNERVVFFGDSITHGGGFHAYVLQAQALRHPASKVRIYNGGVSGGTSGGGFARLEEDILTKKPNRVFIMFGMNDVGINLYRGKDDAAALATRAKRLAAYEKNMTACIERLLKEGIKVVLITPTPYDEYTASFKTTKWVGANEKGLKACADIVRKLAAKYKLPVVDFHTPQTAIIRKGEGIFGRPDRVHPNQVGHYVMGAMMLSALGEKPVEMKVVINAADGKFTAKNVKVTNVKTADGKLSFTYEGKVLPFVSNAAYMKTAQKIYPVAEAFNNEKLIVKGLKSGRYQLLCGNRPVGTFTDKELASGVDMASLRTPAYIAAAKVTGYHNRLYSTQTRLRSIVQMRKHARNCQKSKGLKCVTMEEEFAGLDLFLKRPGMDKNRYYQNLVKAYKRDRPQEEQLKKNVEMYFGKLYEEAAKTVAFPVVIQKVK